MSKAKSKKKNDVLEQKKRALKNYSQRYELALSCFNGIIDALTETSSDIEKTLEEIDTYQKELGETSAELRSAKEKNDKVVKNFKALLN